MTDKKEDPIIITITGPDGDERDYVQDTVIPFAGKEFAVLVSIPEKEDSEEEPDIILARIDRDENGEAVYLPLRTRNMMRWRTFTTPCKRSGKENCGLPCRSSFVLIYVIE